MTWKKSDLNQQSIVDQLRKRYFSVAIISEVGGGIPDLIVGRGGKNLLVEIKNPNRPPNTQKLTPDEQEFHDTWKGKVIIAKTLEDIIKCFE